MILSQPLSTLKDVLVLRPSSHGDERGGFLESFTASAFAAVGIPSHFPQDHVSWSRKQGTVRGLHFQRARSAQGKLVRCTRGEILDVAVDLRFGSPTYARWDAVELRSQDRRVVWIPPGFAHGFWTLTDDTEVHYKATAPYDKAAEGSIRWDDPTIGIQWPGREPILSPSDRDAPLFAESDSDFLVELAAR